MTRISQLQLPPPANWQDFESLCKDLFSKKLKNHLLQKNGRSGQIQHGVDISGKSGINESEYFGIQCKAKDNLTNKTLVEAELLTEVKKAKLFKPTLTHFIIATTAPKDSKIEAVARELTEKHKERGLFSVTVFGWDDILEELENHLDVAKLYYPTLFEKAKPRHHEYIDFWAKAVDLGSLKNNAIIFPFHFFDIRYKQEFLNRMKSYLLKWPVVRGAIPKDDTGQLEVVIAAIENFNLVVTDLIITIELYDNRYFFKTDEYYYWIDVDEEKVHCKSEYIMLRKAILRHVFYALILAANHIIIISDQLGCELTVAKNMISFSQGLHEVEWHPIYGENGDSTLYEGLEAIESKAKSDLAIR
jgi:hypothetical protein